MRFCLLAAAVFAAALSGCGDVPRSRVHGTVKFQGKPLTGATVIFIASDNKTYLTELKEDGSFAAAGVARGPVKVSIQQALPHVPPRPEKPAGLEKVSFVDEKAARKPAPAPIVKDTGLRLPQIYTDPEKSGLAFDLKDPDQEWSVDLK